MKTLRFPLALVVTAVLLGLTSAVPSASARAQSVNRTEATPPNVIKIAEGRYAPAPGYTWVTNTTNDLRVRWAPGQRHPTEPNVIASDRENVFRAAPGYRFINNLPNDLSVAPISRGPSEEAVKNALIKIIGAAIAHSVVEPREDDGIVQSLIREGFRAARDQAIESALKDLFPDAGAREIAGVRRLICLDLDGRLNQVNWVQETAKDELVEMLRHENPNMANGVQVADFLVRLHNANANR